eukprot:9523850-Heterocapsa_arctica.AAC.1
MGKKGLLPDLQGSESRRQLGRWSEQEPRGQGAGGTAGKPSAATSAGRGHGRRIQGCDKGGQRQKAQPAQVHRKNHRELARGREGQRDLQDTSEGGGRPEDGP